MAVTCQYDLTNKTVANEVDLGIHGDIEPALSEEVIVDSPNVAMKITDRSGDDVIASAEVGDPLVSLLYNNRKLYIKFIKEKASNFIVFERAFSHNVNCNYRLFDLRLWIQIRPSKYLYENWWLWTELTQAKSLLLTAMAALPITLLWDHYSSHHLVEKYVSIYLCISHNYFSELIYTLLMRSVNLLMGPTNKRKCCVTCPYKHF